LSAVGCVRTVSQSEAINNKNILIEDIVSFDQWEEILNGFDAIIHLAARAHVLSGSSNNPIDEFRKVNRDATLRLAESASSAGLRRFIYVSSIGVLGNSAPKENAFNNDSIYDPKEPYAISKMEAEIGLNRISKSTEMEVVIIRPPLVYGPAAPGNFHRLLKLVDSGLPLPFAKMNAKKSMISLDNLCDLLVRTVSTPLPKFSKYVVSDGSDWSTSDLVRLIAKYMDRKQSLLPVPVSLLKALTTIVGKSEEIRKLSTPLVVDGSETAEVLGWLPVQSPEDGVRKAVEFYLANK
jgi:nucleoside-diphosphate-sugar epimerase